MHYVYVLKSKKDSSLYIGFTSDLRRRIEQHNNKESGYTSSKAPWEVIYYEAFKSVTDARRREIKLKRHSGAAIHLKKRIGNSLIDSK